MLTLLSRPITLLQPFLLISRAQTNGSSTDLFDVNGTPMSRDQILEVHPEERTPAHWLVVLDWNLARQRPYVVVDPYDPSGLLYLNYSEYLVQMRSFANNNLAFIVVSRPGTHKPVPVKKYPPSYGKRGNTSNEPWTRRILGRQYKTFIDLRKWIIRNCKWGPNGTVLINESNIRGIMMMWHRDLAHLLNLKSPARREEQLEPLLAHLTKLIRHCGPAYSIKWLKVASFAVYSYIAGNPLKTTEGLGMRVRMSNGLPVALGPKARNAIRSGNVNTWRLWSSLLASYRAFHGAHPLPPLETISTPKFTGELGDFAAFCSETGGFWDRLQQRFGPVPEFKYDLKWSPFLSAGANSSISSVGLMADAYAWAKAPRDYIAEMVKMRPSKVGEQLLDVRRVAAKDYECAHLDPREVHDPALLERLGLRQSSRTGLITYNDKGHAERAFLARNYHGPSFDDTSNLFSRDDACHLKNLRAGALRLSHGQKSPLLSRLHAIPEKAGKVRVVAIVDTFTQMACEPIHRYLFEILRKMSANDATFDQTGVLNSFIEKNYQDLFSYDLTAATDSIPIQLYKEVLELPLGRRFVESWAGLLTDRDFLTPKETRKAAGPKWIRYTRGQPMGALSSWAGLAIVHHAIIQFAAHRVGHTEWYDPYLVLGDDDQIAGHPVALEYERVCSEFMIPLNLKKSFPSRRGFGNFASRSFISRTDISPVSLNEALVASNWSRRMEFARRLISRWGDDLSPSQMVRLCTTAPQWAALQGELMGMTTPIFGGVILWFLQNPFMLRLKHEVPYIESILEWLGNIIPGFSKLSREVTSRLTHALCRAVLDEVYVVSKEQRYSLERSITAIEETRSFNLQRQVHIDDPTIEDPITHPLSFTLHILGLCHIKATKLAADYDEIFYEVENQLESGGPMPDMSYIGKLWYRLSRLPKAPCFVDFPNFAVDFLIGLQIAEEKVVTRDRKASVRWEEPVLPPDDIRAPLQSIVRALTAVFGDCFSSLSELAPSLRNPTFWKSVRQIRFSQLGTADEVNFSLRVHGLAYLYALVVPKAYPVPMIRPRPRSDFTCDPSGVVVRAETVLLFGTWAYSPIHSMDRLLWNPL